jgi:hypothetical protein
MMKLKTILLGAALTGVTLVDPSNLVQAQVCPRGEVVPPAQDTRIIRNDRFGYRFSIPKNYRTIAGRDNLIVVLDPASFEWTQCRLRNRDYSEYYGIIVSASPVNPGNRSIAALVRQNNPTVEKIETTKVANQTAAVYTEQTMGYNKYVSFFTPDRKYMITVSVPYRYQQNSRGEGEWVPISSFEEASNTLLSRFTFVRE